MLRWQFPVYSPLTLRSIISGWIGLVADEREAVSTVNGLIRNKLGASDILLTDSGTTALRLAIKTASQLEDNPLVALPAYGCYDIATAADGADANVALYDVDPLTLGPDMDSLEEVLERQPSAVVIAYLYGIPIDLEVLRQRCSQHGVAIIEDAAQGHGAYYRGVPVGSFGDLTILSFGRGKGMTGGSGGALLTTRVAGDEVIRTAAKATGESSAGIKEMIAATAQWILASPWAYAIPASLPFLKLGQTIYRSPTPPTRISRASLRVLSQTWEAAEAEAAERKQNAARILEYVQASQHVDSVGPPPNGEAGYLRLPIIVGEGCENRFGTKEAKRLGVMPSYPTALVDLSGFGERCVNSDERWVGARTLASRLFTVPTHSKLSSKDLSRLERLLLG